jgi:hypothetical protein
MKNYKLKNLKNKFKKKFNKTVKYKLIKINKISNKKTINNFWHKITKKISIKKFIKIRQKITSNNLKN